MKKENRLLSFLFVGIIILLIFTTTFVSAQEKSENLSEAINKLTKAISGIGSSSSTSASSIFESLTFIKILVLILIFLIIFAVAGFIPFIGDKVWIQFGVSAIIAILSVIFMKDEEIYTALLSYGAMGITLTMIIPFIALLAISKKLNEGDNKIPFASKIMWMVFIVILAVRWFTRNKNEMGYFGAYVIPIIAVISLLMFLWENRIWYLAFREQVKEYRDQYRKFDIAELEGELEKISAEIKATSDDAVQQALIKKYNNKARLLRSKGINWFDWGKLR